MAKLSGAKVIATASNDADKKLCQQIGADLVVNHKMANWGNDLLNINGGKKVSRVIDVEFGQNLPEVLKFIDTNGLISTYSSTIVQQPKLPFFQMMYLSLTVRLVIVYAMPEATKVDALSYIYNMLHSNRLQHRISHILPFNEIARGHELIEKGSSGGCVLIDIEK